MTDDQRRILESSYRESPAGEPSFIMEVLVPTAIFTGAAYVAVSVGMTNPQLAELFAAIVCFLSLLILLYLWHQEGRPVHIVERTQYAPEPQSSRLRPVTVSSDEHRWKVGKFDFSESEWRRFAGALRDGKLTRRAIEDLQGDDGARMFPNITEQYRNILAEFKRLGWVGESNEITDVARFWLGGHGITIPPPE